MFLVAGLAFAGCGACSHKSEPVRDVTPVAMAASKIASLQAVRTWATAVTPNNRGGWNFITQTYEVDSTHPTEFVVVDLETGKQTITEGPSGIYTNSNYQFDEALRASNGRIFFPARDGFLAYYEPTTERVEMLGRVIESSEDTLIYRMVFGPDGKLYGGTQSNSLPSVFKLDPDTLEVRQMGRVGTPRASYSYAYYLAADPPWLYIVVGESPWELVALNMQTLESRLLATRDANGFMQFEIGSTILVKLIADKRTPQQRVDIMACVDGALVPRDSRSIRKRDVRPRSGQLSDVPELDLSNVKPGDNKVGRIRWRARGRDWKQAEFSINYTSPIDIESLVALPNKQLLGNARQYHGFFRYDPSGQSLHRLGPLGVSAGPRIALGDVVYLSGYPNSALYAYDPRREWMPDKPDGNPRLVGRFEATGAHYPYFFAASKTRLYVVGRRERTGVGSGIGYYDLDAKQFGGHHDRLEDFDPSGLVVVGDRVVFSGHLRGAANEAALIVYDRDLREVARYVVYPNITDTGQIFPAPDARDVVIGLSPSERAIYRFDVKKGVLLSWRPLDSDVGPATQRPSDGSIWAVIGRDLIRFDARSLDPRVVENLAETPNGAATIAWSGDQLYWATGNQIRSVATP